MSVLACDRRGCDNIMCSVHIDNKYVCDKCVSEFRNKIGLSKSLHSEMLDKFRDFMRSQKTSSIDDVLVDVDEFFQVRAGV